MLFVREGHRLRRLVSHAGVFWREVVVRSHRESHHYEPEANRNLERHPIGPARKEIAHKRSVTALVKNFTRGSILESGHAIATLDVKIFEQFSHGKCRAETRCLLSSLIRWRSLCLSLTCKFQCRPPPNLT